MNNVIKTMILESPLKSAKLVLECFLYDNFHYFHSVYKRGGCWFVLLFGGVFLGGVLVV